MAFSILRLKKKAIPDLHPARAKRKGCRQYPLDPGHRLNREGCADIRTLGFAGENYYHRTDNPPYYMKAKGSIPGLYLRQSVIRKMKEVNRTLRPAGMELYFFDCWRPIKVQNYFHDIWFPARLRKQHPDWSRERIMEETGRYWAKGAPSAKEVNHLSPPPHSTGGVADLTLRSIRTGEHLWMGSLFDDGAEVAHTDHLERIAAKRDLTLTEEEARFNRRLLYWTMISAGFVNNPNEWWHFSWGDQMWAKLSGEKKAFYSYHHIDKIDK